MPSRSPSKQRLEELIALARTYRGWTAKELARELGRDVHHLVPESGVPKLDIVIALADALDWSVQDVVDDLCGNVPQRSDLPQETWADLDRAAYRAYCEGRFEDLLQIASREIAAATTGDERARSCVREYLAWESMGRYNLAADAAQKGLRESDASLEVTLNLRNNLANIHYLLGRHHEAEGIASATLDLVARGRLTSRFITGATGFAHTVRGSARRAIASGSGGDAPLVTELALDAIGDLERGIELLDHQFRNGGDASHDLAAHTCRGALIEASVLGAQLEPDAAIEMVLAGLDDVTDPTAAPRGGRLESYGWWCIFGANIVLRSRELDDRREQLMGVFTNKADEIATRLGNWALRERVWTLELARRRAGEETGGEWLVDRDDLREISGAMARFPAFRDVGWQVLRSVRVRDVAGDSSR